MWDNEDQLRLALWWELSEPAPPAFTTLDLITRLGRRRIAKRRALCLGGVATALAITVTLRGAAGADPVVPTQPGRTPTSPPTWQHRHVIPAVTVEDLPEFGAGQVLLDVREADEWTAGHAPGALHIPMGEIMDRLGELPEDADVFVICRAGGRSARVTAFLNQNGWDAVNIDGGMQSWAAAGKPMVAELPGADPSVI